MREQSRCAVAKTWTFIHSIRQQEEEEAAMFVMINATDNPWMVVLLLFVQVVMPLLQSNAADNEGASLALNVAILFLLGLSLMTFWKATRFCRVLYQLRGQVRSRCICITMEMCTAALTLLVVVMLSV